MSTRVMENARPLAHCGGAVFSKVWLKSQLCIRERLWPCRKKTGEQWALVPV